MAKLTKLPPSSRLSSVETNLSFTSFRFTFTIP
ncbi:hypothetical protein CCACVL1_08916 [Corchorus capsularis]|uniref:Uncharacterized protein n=1 Tax=Corchorus capsularis TaxID=210143 RepID=A0A1R3IYE2_COCAP|nr:hypothetical protein CCACVL1_08916 [Corchorus capsularis]